MPTYTTLAVISHRLAQFSKRLHKQPFNEFVSIYQGLSTCAKFEPTAVFPFYLGSTLCVAIIDIGFRL